MTKAFHVALRWIGLQSYQRCSGCVNAPSDSVDQTVTFHSKSHQFLGDDRELEADSRRYSSSPPSCNVNSSTDERTTQNELPHVQYLKQTTPDVLATHPEHQPSSGSKNSRRTRLLRASIKTAPTEQSQIVR